MSEYYTEAVDSDEIQARLNYFLGLNLHFVMESLTHNKTNYSLTTPCISTLLTVIVNRVPAPLTESVLHQSQSRRHALIIIQHHNRSGLSDLNSFDPLN